LFIAYYFGRRNIFSQLAMTCVLQANTGNGDEFLIDGGYRCASPYHTGKHCQGFLLKPYPLEKDNIPLPSGIVGMAFSSMMGDR
jgi:hypothetical protein